MSAEGKTPHEENAYWRRWLQQYFAASSDFVVQELFSHGTAAQLLYLKSICDEKQIQQRIIAPFVKVEAVDRFLEYIQSQAPLQLPENEHDLLQSIIRGEAILFLDEHLFMLPMKINVIREPDDTAIESAVLGGRKALSEEIGVSVNMIRSRYNDPALIVEETKVGSRTQTPLAIVYDGRYVDREILAQVKEQIAAIPLPVVTAASQLQRELTPSKRRLFPVLMVTERPDRAIYNLAQGKIVLLLDGTPFAVVLPAVFFDFFAAMDDLYFNYWVTKALLVFRYIGLFITLMLAPVYVAFTSYNPEFFRVQLALSIAGSRAPVPYPSYIEVLFMLLMMELLTEASLRLPKTIGSTATTVGGLILGQAATQAGLVSNIMIIIVAAVAISNFVIPNTEMSSSMRLVKYVFLLVTTMFGLLGLVLALIVFIAYLTSLDSYGKPYLKLALFWNGPQRME
jgi:spore germination protein